MNSVEKILTIAGNKQRVSDAIALAVTTIFAASLLWLGVSSDVAVGVGIPTWFLCSGMLEALGAGFVTDPARQERSGRRFFFGMAKAFSAVVFLISSAVYIWAAR